MARFWTVVEGLEGKDELEMVSFVKNARKVHVKKMAYETQIIIRRIIKSRVSRAGTTGNLAKWAGDVELSLNIGQAGVGNIDRLNDQAPYWRHINFGSLAIGANWKHRVPIGAFDPGFTPPGDGTNQRWFVAQGGTSFVPRVPIPPMNYIEATIAVVNARAQSILGSVSVRTIAVFG